jgi:hypothetical protein
MSQPDSADLGDTPKETYSIHSTQNNTDPAILVELQREISIAKEKKVEVKLFGEQLKKLLKGHTFFLREGLFFHRVSTNRLTTQVHCTTNFPLS